MTIQPYGRSYIDENGKLQFTPEKPKTAAEVIANMKSRFDIDIKPASEQVRAKAREMMHGIRKDAEDRGMKIFQDV